MARVRISVGPSPNELTPVPPSDHWQSVKSDGFQGHVSAHVKHQTNEDGEPVEDAYFKDKVRTAEDVSWSIEFVGQFTETVNGDSLIFGNVFDEKLVLPWGFSGAVGAIGMLEPTLVHDFYADKPWTYSPLLSSMPYLHRERGAVASPPKSSTPMQETPSSPVLSSEITSTNRKDRKAFFRDPAKRKEVTFTPEDVIRADFCHAYIDFSTMYLTLPGGFQFDLSRYANQPIRFVLAESNDKASDASQPMGRIFFCVQFELIKDEP